MINRIRAFALVLAAAALLPAVAQAHWYEPCGCQRAPLYRNYHSHYHYRYYAPRRYLAEQLVPNVFAIPYRLRRYPYVSGFGGYGERGIVSVTEPATIESERGQQRVIDADAQVTILGPDRMNIRLFRKGRGRIINPGQ
ncbi:MAG TPA: hypothetical protein VMG39_06685 [Pseudolabrys sp.]|nr:hypothetical protein [Pseudolabrys sp.]